MLIAADIGFSFFAAWRQLQNGIFQCAEGRHLDADAVARFQVAWRFEADPDTNRRSGRNDVAGLERDRAPDGADQCRDIEDQVADRGGLAAFIVDPEPNGQRGYIRYRIGGDECAGCVGSSAIAVLRLFLSL